MQEVFRLGFWNLVLGWKRTFGSVSAFIPQNNFTCAVIPFRNGPLEAAIIERMIFDVNRETFDRRIKRRPLGHSPGLQYAVDFQTKVVVQTSCVMALDNERIVAGGRGSAAWLRAGAFGPFSAIFVQRFHLTSIGDLLLIAQSGYGFLQTLSCARKGIT